MQKTVKVFNMVDIFPIFVRQVLCNFSTGFFPCDILFKVLKANIAFTFKDTLLMDKNLRYFGKSWGRASPLPRVPSITNNVKLYFGNATYTF